MTREQEHNVIAEKAQDCYNSTQKLYEKYHNGDKEQNRIIMSAWDDAKDIRTLLRTHISRTEGDDAKIDKYNKVMTVAWVFGTAFVASLGTLLAKVFEYI